MENQKTTEEAQVREKHGRIMRNVAYTFTHKKEEVKGLIKEINPEIPDNASRGEWVSNLMKNLRNNDEFRLAFAELMIEKKSFRQQLRSKLAGEKETRQERSEKVAQQQAERKGNNQENFYGFEGQLLPGDPQVLAEELRAAATATDESELEGLIKNSQQTKNTTNIVFIGGIILISWYVYDKWIK